MARQGEDPDVADLIGYWDFVSSAEREGRDASVITKFRAARRALPSSMRDGRWISGAGAADAERHGDGEGTIEIVFSQQGPADEDCDILFHCGALREHGDDIYFALGATACGRIEVTHCSGDADLFLRTKRGLLAEGDTIVARYGWSASRGGSLRVTNLRTALTETVAGETKGLSFIRKGDTSARAASGPAALLADGHILPRYPYGGIERVAIFRRDIVNCLEENGRSAPSDTTLTGASEKDTAAARTVASPSQLKAGRASPASSTKTTLIATPAGPRPLDSLRPGDKVMTRDNGFREVRWAGSRGLTGADLEKNPHLKPILIHAGALGEGLPEQDLLLSPNHRVLVSNDKTALYFEEPEVLVAAKHLTALEGIAVHSPRWTTYHRVLFDQHEQVLCNGAWTEFFHPSDYSLGGVGNAQRLETLELFPELEPPVSRASYQAAHRSLKRYEAELRMRP